MTVEQVAQLALALPEVTEGERYGTRTWNVAGKAFAWERPFVQLKTVAKRALREALLDGWLACAPPHLAKQHVKP